MRLLDEFDSPSGVDAEGLPLWRVVEGDGTTKAWVYLRTGEDGRPHFVAYGRPRAEARSRLLSALWVVLWACLGVALAASALTSAGVF